jgi:hypothetical protein
MTNTPTKPTPSPQARLNAYRFAGAVVALGITALLEWLAAGWPPILRSGIELAIGGVYGKLFGMPLREVVEGMLRRNPVAALEVASSALASLPPIDVEHAIASLPPDMRLRVSMAPPGIQAPGMIVFTGGSDAPPPADLALRSAPMPEGGHGYTDADLTAVADAPGAAENTRPTRPRR